MKLERFALTAGCSLAIIAIYAAAPVMAASGSIYTDSLQNGWQSWPWAKTVKLDNTKPVHSGSKSILVLSKGWDALSLNRTKASSAGFKTFSFWIYDSGTIPQPISVFGLISNKPQKKVALPPLAPKTWRHVSIPLSQLGVANKPDLTGFWIQDGGGKGISVVVDDVALMP